jgi:hypothetical protein
VNAFTLRDNEQTDSSNSYRDSVMDEQNTQRINLLIRKDEETFGIADVSRN